MNDLLNNVNGGFPPIRYVNKIKIKTKKERLFQFDQNKLDINKILNIKKDIMIPLDENKIELIQDI